MVYVFPDYTQYLTIIHRQVGKYNNLYFLPPVNNNSSVETCAFGIITTTSVVIIHLLKLPLGKQNYI